MYACLGLISQAPAQHEAGGCCGSSHAVKMRRFFCVHSASSQVSGVTALLSLSKKTPLLVRPHFQLPSFRMRWHPCSIRAFEGRNRAGSEWHRHFYLCNTTRRESQTNSPEMNTSKTKEFKSPAMNTCMKVRGGRPRCGKHLVTSVTIPGIF